MSELRPDRQRQFAVDVVKKLCAAGYTAYWAGGCVRDRLLGATPKDYDVATDATPEAIREVFGRRRTIGVGAAFGVIAVLGGRGAGQIEVATFRRDATYSDGRHPDAVTFSDDREDALRRDFTINGLFYDPLTDRVIDYVAGQADLEQGILRAIGDPRDRFAEDKLRLLRAVRFAAVLDFQMESRTLAAVKSLAGDITSVSAERIAQEMRLMLQHPRRDRALELLYQTALLAEVLPEAEPLFASAAPDAADGPWQQTLRVLAQLASPNFSLALAALLHAVPDAASDPKALSDSVGARWRLANKEVEQLSWLLTRLPAIAAARSTPWPRLQRVLISPGIEDLLTLSQVVDTATGGDGAAVEHCRALLAQPQETLNPAPLLDGNDLIRHGVPRGKVYGELLERVRDAQLEGKIDNAGDALRLVDRWLAGRADD